MHQGFYLFASSLLIDLFILIFIFKSYFFTMRVKRIQLYCNSAETKVKEGLGQMHHD